MPHTNEDHQTDAERARENQLVERVAQRVSGQVSGAAQQAVSGLKDDIMDLLKGREKAVPRNGNACRCKVTAPGYTEQFAELADARKAYNKQVSKLYKREERGVVKLYAEDFATSSARSVKWNLVQEVRVDEDAFE